MEATSLNYAAHAVAGELSGGTGAELALRVSTDSRQAQAGDLFFAIRGEHFDGHEFLSAVAQQGSACLVVSRDFTGALPASCPVITVDDPRLALGRLAARYREDFTLPLIAVGGSNGKTTTKDILAAVLRQALDTLASHASFNNDIGVPLTLLQLERRHQAAVLEIGTNHPGEIAALMRLARPRIAIVTSIGREHLEFFSDLDGVIREEGALAEELPADGLLVTNGDGPWAEAFAQRTKARVVRVGFGESNDWRVTEVRPDDLGTSFVVAATSAEWSGEYRVNLLGRHQATNAVLALVVAVELGLDRAQIERGLAECQAANMRMQLWEANGVRVLDDAYNANTDSMISALRALMELPGHGRRIAVLGDMAELGPHSATAHEEVGRVAAELGVGQLIAVGAMASAMAGAARAAGLLRVFEFAEVESARAAIKRFFKPGDLVLLKASRATRLERVANVLRLPDEKRVECFTS